MKEFRALQSMTEKPVRGYQATLFSLLVEKRRLLQLSFNLLAFYHEC